jgi:hypothetical protein
VIDERQRLVHKGVCHAGALQHDRSIRTAMDRAQAIDALRGERGWRQPMRSSVEHRFGWTSDERRNHSRPFRERGGNEIPDFLRIPRRQRDHRARREVVLK